MSDRELVLKEPELVVPANAERVLAALKRFEDFKSKAIGDDDYVKIGEKPYIKKSGWLKFALACNISLEKRDESFEDREDGTRIFHFTYRAIAPNGRYVDAVGSASSRERKFAHVDHDPKALAQTRAMNRSISNLVAGGVPSAEEMEEGDPPREREEGRTANIQPSTRPSRSEQGAMGSESRTPDAEPGKSDSRQIAPGPPKGRLAQSKEDDLVVPPRTPQSRSSTGNQAANITTMCRKYKNEFGFDLLPVILERNGVGYLGSLTFEQAEEAVKWLGRLLA